MVFDDNLKIKYEHTILISSSFNLKPKIHNIGKKQILKKHTSTKLNFLQI